MLYVNKYFREKAVDVGPYVPSTLDDVKLVYVFSVLRSNYFSRKKSAATLKISVRGLRNMIYKLRARGYEVPNPKESSQ